MTGHSQILKARALRAIHDDLARARERMLLHTPEWVDVIALVERDIHEQLAELRVVPE